MPTTAATLRRAAADPAMRRLQSASAGWAAGEAAYLVGVFVIAYTIAGPASVAGVAVLRTLPSIVLAPTMAALAADRPVDHLLRLTLTARVVLVTLLGWVLWSDAPIVLAAVLVAGDSVAATFLRPLRGAALPAVARTPEELVAGNVALTTGDSLANLLGPTLAAICLVVAGPLSTFVPGLLLLGTALVAVLGLQAATPRAAARATIVTTPAPRAPRFGGLRWLSHSPAAAIVGVMTAQRCIRGALTVLLVTAAIDLLGMGDPGVGWLTAAMGLGGLIGGAGAIALIGRDRLVPALVGGIAVWGLGIALIGVVPLAGVALLTLAVGGIGKVLIDVTAATLLQRTVPNAMRTRVLGIQEGLVTAALATGSVLASVLIGSVGIAWALVIAGLVPIVAALVAWPALRRVDAAAVVPLEAIDLLRRIPMFEPLPLATIEELAAGLEHRTVAAGMILVHQGEAGHQFAIVETGSASVAIDGTVVRTIGPGEGFGEVALVRDVPRTATITALTELRVAEVDRDRFLAAVTGHRGSRDTADRIVAGYLSDTAAP